MKYTSGFGVVPDAVQREELSTALYSMARDVKESHWSYVFGRMNLVSDDTCRVVSATGTQDGYLITGINFNAFMLLTLEAQKCALKHVCLHWLNAHISSRVNDLRNVYGDDIVGTATDLVIAPLLDHTPLFELGYVIPEPAMYGLEEGLTTEEYCMLLRYEDALPSYGSDEVVTSSVDDVVKKAVTGEPPSFVKNGKVDRDAMAEAIQSGEIIPVSMDQLNMSQAGGACDHVLDSLIRETMQKYKGHGWLTAETEQRITAIDRKNVIPWNTLIKQKHRKHTDLLREATKLRPSRRHAAYFGRRHASKCSVTVWIDTSGSMQERELALINSELDALERKHTHIVVGHVDAAVCGEPVVYKRGDKLESFFGRGGTDFRPAFDWMAKNVQVSRPDFVIYFTDGYGYAYNWEDLPGWTKSADILWVLTDTGMTVDTFRKQVAHYGDAVVFDTHSGVDEKHYK